MRRSTYGPCMARRKRSPGPNLDQPGQPPLLQGHLRAGGTRDPDLPGAGAGVDTDTAAADRPSEAGTPASAQPATEGARGEGDAVKGKATRSPAEVATRPHLEGSEQSPM
jgi:hypothetical protein